MPVSSKFLVFLKFLIDRKETNLKQGQKSPDHKFLRTLPSLSKEMIQIMLRGLYRAPRIWCTLLMELSSGCLGVPSDPQRSYLEKFSHLCKSYHREEGPRESKGKLTLFAHLITRKANMDSYIFFLLSTTF